MKDPLRKTVSALFVALVTGATGLACSDDPAEPGEDDVILMRATTFSQPTRTIAVGTTIRWVNDQAIQHTITPDDPNQPGVWVAESVPAQAGFAFEHTFNVSGETYEYTCTIHAATMTGTIVVQ